MENRDVRYTREPFVRRCCIAVPIECKSIAEYEFRLDEDTSFYYCRKHMQYYVDGNESLSGFFKPIDHTLDEIVVLQANANEEFNKNMDNLSSEINKEGTLTNVLKQRGTVYGDIRCNMNCRKEIMAVIKRWFVAHQNNNPSYNLSVRDEVAWQGCMEVLVHKIARMITGDITYEDNYVDIGGYAKLMNDIVQPYRGGKDDTVRVDR